MAKPLSEDLRIRIMTPGAPLVRSPSRRLSPRSGHRGKRVLRAGRQQGCLVKRIRDQGGRPRPYNRPQ
jgi:hypothetical protein